MNVMVKKSKWTKIKPFTMDMKVCKGIYSDNEFKEVLKYERIRSDRNNSSFSITLFKSSEIYESKKNLNNFIEEIKRQVRVIDHIGWYDNQHIAALLPDTQRQGAVILGNKILGNVDFLKDADSAFEVYTYPDHWMNKSDVEISTSSLDNRRKNSLNFSACVENQFTTNIPVWKRSLDIILAFIGLILTSPIFILLPLYIKIVSPGPIFFHQPRVGYKGKEFCFWKFRSMYADNKQSFHGKHAQNFIKDGDKPMEKLDSHDPRIIPGGKFMRKSCIDELPQLWNVLKGDMSLVGPRPCIPYEAEEYLRWHTHRFDVVPGLTGLWQVSGKNKLTFKQMIRLDIAYSNNFSIFNDLWIIGKTPYAITKMVFEAVEKKFKGRYSNDVSMNHDMYLQDSSRISL